MSVTPRDIFNTLRKIKLTQEDLKKDIQEFEVDGIIIVINGDCKILDINISKVRDDTNLERKLIHAINTAIEAVQVKHLESLKTLNIN